VDSQPLDENVSRLWMLILALLHWVVFYLLVQSSWRAVFDAPPAVSSLAIAAFSYVGAV
jgi:hypothetical protein